MVTIDISKYHNPAHGIDGVEAVEAGDIYCKSTDTKPTENVPNGMRLLEMDTGDIYVFDAETKTWLNPFAGGEE